MKKIFYFFVILTAIFLVISCNKKEEAQQDSSTNKYLKTLFSKEPSKNDLQWSNKAANQLDWYSAGNYCKNLNEGGFSDWKLPNIDELRTLIQYNSGTETGGTCKVSEKSRKLSRKNRTDDCEGSVEEGINYNKLGDEGWFWSSSVVSDSSGFAWGVNFQSADVDFLPANGSQDIRCVRHSANKASAKPPQTEPVNIESLLWSNKAPYEMNRQEAINYCKKLNEGGFSRWRLPSIGELRRTIKNCSGSQYEGSCQVSAYPNKCLAHNCWSKNCSCDEIESHNQGYYSVLGDDETVVLWSSSRTDSSNFGWIVDFSNGGINLASTNINLNVRCVTPYISDESY